MLSPLRATKTAPPVTAKELKKTRLSTSHLSHRLNEIGMNFIFWVNHLFHFAWQTIPAAQKTNKWYYDSSKMPIEEL